MSDPFTPEIASTAEVVDEVSQAKQIVDLVKENQLLTALVLFILWQTGAAVSAVSYVQGGVC